MKKIFLFLILLIIPFMINGKELELEWQKSIGSVDSDSPCEILVTENKESILFFHSSSVVDDFENKGSVDIYIYKFDEYGNEIWKKQWGGDSTESFSSAFLTKNDDIILSIQSSSNIDGLQRGKAFDAIIIKYDKDGNLLWQTSIAGNEYDIINKIYELKDGSLIAVGRTKSNDIDGLTNAGNFDVIIFKYDKDGNLLWKKSWGGSHWDETFSVGIDNNDNILIAGSTRSSTIGNLTNNGNYDIFLIKYDKDGNLLWQNLYGGSSGDYVSNLLVLSNNDIVVFGSMYSTDIDGISNNGDMDAIVVKYDKDGNLLWQRSFGGSGDDIFSIAIEEDDDIILIGNFSSTDIENLDNMGNVDSFIIRYDKDGNIKWYKGYGGSEDDYFFSVFSSKNMGHIILGITNSSKFDGVDGNGNFDVLIVLFDKDWNLISKYLWGGSEEEFTPFGYGALVDNTLFVASSFYSTDIDNLINKGKSDCVLIKYSLTFDIELLNTLNGTASTDQEGNMGIITPIPNEGYEVDKIIVRDVDGNVLGVEVTKMEDGTYSFPLSDDVKIEVLFKEVLSNPKTGVFDYISFILVGLLICAIGYISINQYNRRFEL